MMKFTEEQKTVFTDFLDFSLPKGSGINSDWQIYWQRNRVIAKNYYHTMNDAGYYDTIVGFTVAFRFDQQLGAFRLTFDGDNKSQYAVRKYMLREFLEDTLYHSAAVYPHRDMATCEAIRLAKPEYRNRWLVHYRKSTDRNFPYAAFIYADTKEKAIEAITAKPWWNKEHYSVTGTEPAEPGLFNVVIGKGE